MTEVTFRLAVHILSSSVEDDRVVATEVNLVETHVDLHTQKIVPLVAKQREATCHGVSEWAGRDRKRAESKRGEK